MLPSGSATIRTSQVYGTGGPGNRPEVGASGLGGAAAPLKVPLGAPRTILAWCHSYTVSAPDGSAEDGVPSRSIATCTGCPAKGARALSIEGVAQAPRLNAAMTNAFRMASPGERLTPNTRIAEAIQCPLSTRIRRDVDAQPKATGVLQVADLGGPPPEPTGSPAFAGTAKEN
jgi:hypothetical protein